MREKAKRRFPVVSGRSRGRGGTQHLASSSAGNTATSCVSGPLRPGGWEEDPEPGVFGSWEWKKAIDADNALMRGDC